MKVIRKANGKKTVMPAQPEKVRLVRNKGKQVEVTRKGPKSIRREFCKELHPPERY